MITPEMLAQYRKIILRPVVTEKSMAQVEAGGRSKYTFEVAPTANKTEIRRAVEALWGVHVVQVNTMNVRGKDRRQSFKYRIGTTARRKKAIVTLAQGQTIDVLGA